MTYKGSVGKSLVNQHTFDHSSELKGLCLMKLPSEALHNCTNFLEYEDQLFNLLMNAQAYFKK